MSEYGLSGWFVMALGMGTVFVGLVCLIFVTMLMSFFCRLKKEKPVEAAPVSMPSAAAPAAPVAVAPAAIMNRPQFVAAVSSAIAASMGTEPSGLRIHSIRQTGGAPAGGRGELAAAVSAAIAAEMGGDVNHLRIHSMRQV